MLAMCALAAVSTDAFPPRPPKPPAPLSPSVPLAPQPPEGSTPPPPPPPDCREELVQLATFATPLSNCSASPASTIAAFVGRTDAAYEGLIRPGDRLMANDEWVAWIDTQDAPGIVRGLWGVDAGVNFVGIIEPEIAPDAAKSVLAITRGFNSVDAPDGYKGLHVEIWKTLERASPVADECAPANCFYAVPNGVQAEETPDTVRTTASDVSASYTTLLVNVIPATPSCPSCGTNTFVGLNGVSTQLVWTVNYKMTRDSFTISTALGANADVEFSGAAGGLLLLLNPGCRAMARNAFPGDRFFRNCDPAQVAERSIHHVEGPSIGTGRAVPSTDRIVVDGSQADVFAPQFQTIDPNEDRYVNQYNDTDPFTFRYQDGRVAMTVTPGWGVSDPNAVGWGTGFAFHFNSSPANLGYDPGRGLSGLSGIASVDAYTQPSCPLTCRLAVGPTRGFLFWQMTLTR